MNLSINTERLLTTMEQLINTPSVVGYYPEVHRLLEAYAHSRNLPIEYDRRHTAYIKLEGRRHDKTVCLGAHLDTIGMVVRSIDDNGWLHVRNLGGVNFHSVEGENVFVHTHFQGTYTGMVICEHHSVHVFEDARDMKRDFENMRVVLDEDVHSKEEVMALGVRPGDLISVEPRFRVCESGYIKSRHIDDKASVAVLLEAIDILLENGLQPTCDTWFAFPIYEEIGLGGAYVPEEVDEYLALDIALVDGLQCGDEKKVTIGCADAHSVYDWDLCGKLIALAEKYDVNAVEDVYYRYGSDATAALKGGNNITPATIGMGTLTSHGYERTHIEGVQETLKLTLAYILEP